jgi:hypothetical protein
MGTTYAIGQNANGSLNGTGASAEYVYGGTIAGFQSGDTIGLMENGTGATPASLSYDATAGVLTIKDAGGNVLGALNIPNVSATDSFILTQQPPGPDSPGYTSQYTISLADVAATGASGDINSGSAYVNGAAPSAGGVVDIGTGKAKLTSGEQPVASTIVLGANPNATTHLSNSSLSITDDAIAANVTIDATDLGGTFSPGEATAMFGAIGANGGSIFCGRDQCRGGRRACRRGCWRRHDQSGLFRRFKRDKRYRRDRRWRGGKFDQLRLRRGQTGHDRKSDRDRVRRLGNRQSQLCHFRGHGSGFRHKFDGEWRHIQPEQQFHSRGYQYGPGHDHRQFQRRDRLIIDWPERRSV